MPRVPRAMLHAALGVAAALACVPLAARAQGTPPRPPQRDTARTRGDTAAVAAPPRDSVQVDSSAALKAEAQKKAPVVKVDTLRAPTARSEAPVLLDPGERFRWNREELFATGAVTLLDLLDRVPGLTGFRTGFLAQPEVGAYLGDAGRVRVFLDGLELDGLERGAGGQLDLGGVQIWALEDVAVERSASELRVYARTWRTRSTTPVTRVDALTGDQRLTLFRGFYGTRGRHGEVAQFGVQQFGLGDARSAGGSSLGLTGRLGWARGRLSVDAYGERVRRDQDAATSVDPTYPRIAARRGTQTNAYVRAALGDPESGAWVQALAGTERALDATPTTSTVVDTTAPDTLDPKNASRAQYVVAGGVTRGPARFSLTDRVRGGGGRTLNDAVARAALEARIFSVRGYAEFNSRDSTTRLEAEARFRPLPFVSLGATVSRAAPRYLNSASSGTTDARAEGGVRVAGAWITGGVIVRDSARLSPLRLLGGVADSLSDARATGTFASVRGRVFRALYADAYGVRWSNPGLFRPQYESRAQLSFVTRWLTRFPSGNFGLNAAVLHEYRSGVAFPNPVGDISVASGSRVPGLLVELRIVNAVLSYQYRNFLRERYQLVPGAYMPPGVNVYGVRWEFSN